MKYSIGIEEDFRVIVIWSYFFFLLYVELCMYYLVVGENIE